MPHDLQGDGFAAVMEQPAPRDHNNPPGLLPLETILLEAKAKHTDTFTRAAELLAAEDRVPKGEDGKTLICATDEDERKFTELARQLSECHTKLDLARTNEIAPFRDRVSAVHGLFRDVMDKLVDPDKKTAASLRHRVERALTAYKLKKVEIERARLAQEAEQRRLEQEAAKKKADEEAAAAQAEADRLKAEADAAAAKARGPKTSQRATDLAAAAEAAQQRADDVAAQGEQAVAAKAEETARAEGAVAAPAASFTRARSANAMSSLQEFVNFRDLDRNRLDLESLRAHIPADALDQALRSYIGANSDALKEDIKNRRQPVRGVTFFIDARTGTR